MIPYYRSLDLSSNHITADLSSQRVTLESTLTPLKQLKYLNLANNKFQNKGLLCLLQYIKDKMLALETLDVSSCFITSPKCNEIVIKLLKMKTPILKYLILQDNLLLPSDVKELLIFSKLDENSPNLILNDWKSLEFSFKDVLPIIDNVTSNIDLI